MLPTVQWIYDPCRFVANEVVSGIAPTVGFLADESLRTISVPLPVLNIVSQPTNMDGSSTRMKDVLVTWIFIENLFFDKRFDILLRRQQKSSICSDSVGIPPRTC